VRRPHEDPASQSVSFPAKPRRSSIVALGRRCRGEAIRRRRFPGAICSTSPSFLSLALTGRRPRPRRHAAEAATTSPTGARDPVCPSSPHVVYNPTAANEPLVSSVMSSSCSRSNPCRKWCPVAPSRLLRRCSGELPAVHRRAPAERPCAPLAGHPSRPIVCGRSRSYQRDTPSTGAPWTRRPRPRRGPHPRQLCASRSIRRERPGSAPALGHRSRRRPPARTPRPSSDPARTVWISPRPESNWKIQVSRASRRLFLKETPYFLSFATRSFHL
jgi:hypothetical protein